MLGFLASAFDPLHPGYVWAMQQAIDAGLCKQVIAALHTDPSIERGKPKPVLTVEERLVLLSALKQTARVAIYDTEQELRKLLATVGPVVRILGDDYLGNPYVGDDLGFPVFYAKRREDWSGTKFRERWAKCLD